MSLDEIKKQRHKLSISGRQIFEQRGVVFFFAPFPQPPEHTHTVAFYSTRGSSVWIFLEPSGADTRENDPDVIKTTSAPTNRV
jgi:hypothetical protein